jgi:dUTP pyrophosphatase
MKFEEPVLKFKKLNYVEGVDENGTPIIKESQGVLPVRAHDTDAGYDIVCTRLTQELDEAGKVVLVYHTDVAVEIPQGMVGFLLMRSSVSKKSIMLTNCVGIIDSGYRGELMMKFKLTTDALPRVYQIGDKIGQLVVVPYYKATPVFVEELSNTDRGENGYGSTDKKEKSGTDLILETKELAKDEHNTGEPTTGNSEVSGDNR